MHVTLCVRNLDGPVTQNESKPLKKHLKEKLIPPDHINTSLSAGYTYVDARSLDSGAPLLGVPSQIVKLGLHYDDKRLFRGTLLGRYVWYNSAPDYLTKDKAIIWDLNLAGKVFAVNDLAFELFFTAHNLFNGAQFNDPNVFENARRWLEGGARFNF